MSLAKLSSQVPGHLVFILVLFIKAATKKTQDKTEQRVLEIDTSKRNELSKDMQLSIHKKQK